MAKLVLGIAVPHSGMLGRAPEGWPEDGIAPGTRWEAIPAGWCCPECGARKEDFEMVEA